VLRAIGRQRGQGAAWPEVEFLDGRPIRQTAQDTVVWGTEDRIIPSAQAEAVAGAARHLIDGAGHMPHMERPAEVQAAIEEAIAGAPRWG
jgi:pimeloyl-ACP methyl ester carboxylesterase